jgi:hypothetical protein
MAMPAASMAPATSHVAIVAADDHAPSGSRFHTPTVMFVPSSMTRTWTTVPSSRPTLETLSTSLSRWRT